MNAYMERERKRQIEEGVIEEDSEKINLQTAIEREDDKWSLNIVLGKGYDFMKGKDPNKELIQYVEDTGFYKTSVRLEMDAYLEKERGRQKETGTIGTDNVKIDVRSSS